MRKILLIPLTLLMFVGCASVVYTKPDGEQFSYHRLGTQRLDNFVMSKDKEGRMKIAFTKQEGGENINEIVKNVTEVAMTAMTRVP